MNQQSLEPGEKPRFEPEIIPPGEAASRQDGHWSSRGTQRVYVARLGPFSFFLIAAAIAAVAVLAMVLIVGAFLLWIPIAGLLLAVAVVSGMLRGRRLRS
jgi:hypothetical protein